MSLLRMDRRTLLKLGAGSAAGLGALAAAPLRAFGMGRPRPGANPFETPTFSAFVDTIIPGAGSDPTGAPGALEAGTLEYLQDLDQSGIFPVSLQLVEFAVNFVLDGVSMVTHFCPFPQLNLDDRTRLIASLQGIEGVPFLLRLIRAPFYTGSVNRVGWDYVGYPGGPNAGYPDFSFDEPDIAPPHPDSVGGNLP